MRVLLLLGAVLQFAALARSKAVPEGYGKITWSTPMKSLTFPNSGNGKGTKYQFVGIINEKSGRVEWHCRRAKTSKGFKLRMLQVNKNAMIRDMLLDKSVDVYVTYRNSGKVNPENGKFLIEPKYELKDRRWANGWNTSAKSLKNFLQPKNREPRVPKGVYTDGSMCYRPKYLYTTGVNVFVPIGGLRDMIRQGQVTKEELKKLTKRVKNGTPDVVREP